MNRRQARFCLLFLHSIWIMVIFLLIFLLFEILITIVKIFPDIPGTGSETVLRDTVLLSLMYAAVALP